MAIEYRYAKKDGSMGTVSANSDTEALGLARTAVDAAKGTGVMKVPSNNTTAPLNPTPPAPTNPTPAPNPATPQPGAVPSPYTTPAPKSSYNPDPTTSINRPIYADEPTIVKEKSVEEIQGEKQRQAQAEIDALNNYYNTLRNEQQVINEGNVRKDNAISTLTGLGGSSEANLSNTKTVEAGSKALAKVEQERAVAISAILSNIRTSAVEEARQSRLDARASEAERLAFREKAQANAIASLTQLSKGESGASLEGLKATLSPEEYSTLIKNAGGEAMARAVLFENRAKNSVMGNPTIVGGQMVQAYTTPQGKVIYEKVDLPEGIDANKVKSVEKTDNGLFIINEDGTWSKITGSGKNTTGTSGTGGGATGVSTGATGSVARDAESVMAGVLNLQDISTAGNYRAVVASELAKRSKEALESGDIYGAMKASAAYDKEPSDTFLQGMEKGQVVLDQLGTLQQNIDGVKTGPIVGAFKSANPWDTKAQTIKAQLNAIVPNLARGIYGEVGVLTDNDIRIYAKTIPNLTSTEDVRNAILYITIDMIRKNLETKIKNQAAGQRDMSGYADTYRQIQAKANAVLATLPGASAPGGSTTLTPEQQQLRTKYNY